MITRGATGPTSAPNSPTSRAGTPPSDSEAPATPAAAVDVVDVTGGSDPWTTTPARRTAEPTPLRPSKRTSAKAVAAATLAEARKGKKRLVRRPASGPVAGKDSAGAGPDSDSSLEDKPAPPPSKKTRKTPATKAAAAVKTPGSAKVVSTDTAQAPRKPARADAGFNLGAFMASFDPEAAISERSPSEATRAAAPRAQEEPAASISAEMGAQLRTLRAEVERLRAMVANQPVSQAATPSSVLPLAVLSAPTAPNAKGELPPSEVCFLTTASFPEGAKKAKGDYNPPQAHMLAASRMFRAFGSETGTALSAMSFVLWMRELESIKFQVTPAVLMAIFSGRLGSRGLTLMHFKESSEMSSLEDGSTNVNFSSDFSPSASLPPASIRCKTYEDILDALHGLNALGQEVWYDHMRKITSRLRNFVAKNKSADPANTPARVRLTLLYANKFIGAALGHMQSDNPQWWTGFSEALRGIDYQSPVWTMALVGALTQEPDPGHADTTARGSRDSSRRETGRRPAIPDAIRRLIPINRKGQEPCLLNVAGLPCSGGNRDRCGNPRRVHDWPERLPSRLLDWVERTYGGRNLPHEDRR